MSMDACLENMTILPTRKSTAKWHRDKPEYYPLKWLSIAAISVLAPALIAYSKFLDTKSTAVRKFSSSASGDNPVTWVTSDWHSGRRRVDCRVAGLDRRELGRVEMRDCGLNDEALEAGRAEDKLEGGR